METVIFSNAIYNLFREYCPGQTKVCCDMFQEEFHGRQLFEGSCSVRNYSGKNVLGENSLGAGVGGMGQN